MAARGERVELFDRVINGRTTVKYIGWSRELSYLQKQVSNTEGVPEARARNEWDRAPKVFIEAPPAPRSRLPASSFAHQSPGMWRRRTRMSHLSRSDAERHDPRVDRIQPPQVSACRRTELNAYKGKTPTWIKKTHRRTRVGLPALPFVL